MNLSANLLAWDASTDALYAAVEDSNVVRAVEADGQLRFEVELEGAVHDIQAIGNKGLMGVVTSYGKDSHRSGGHFMTIDGYTGAITSSQSIPQAASFEVSKDGKRLAFVLDHTVHFFDMN